MGRKAKDDDEQAVMFPELDNSPEHKAIVKDAKRLIKIRDLRKEALTESKAKEDEIQSSLVTAMHKADLTRFNYKGLKVEIVPSSEKVKAKLEADVDEEASPEEEDAE